MYLVSFSFVNYNCYVFSLTTAKKIVVQKKTYVRTATTTTWYTMYVCTTCPDYLLFYYLDIMDILINERAYLPTAITYFLLLEFFLLLRWLDDLTADLVLSGYRSL